MEAEQVFLHRLARALPENIILAQVPLSHFLGVKEGFSNWEWNQRIKQMSVNFLICRKDSSIIAAIELDDSSNSQNQKRERDKKKDQVIRAAGIVLIKCDLRHIPTEQGIRELIGRLDHPQSQDDQRRNARRLKDRREVELSGKDEPR